jgi:hypothetical protein
LIKVKRYIFSQDFSQVSLQELFTYLYMDL